MDLKFLGGHTIECGGLVEGHEFVGVVPVTACWRKVRMCYVRRVMDEADEYYYPGLSVDQP